MESSKSNLHYLQKLLNCQVTDTTENFYTSATSAGKCCHLRVHKRTELVL